MVDETGTTGRVRPPAMAVLAALALAGCASGHVGEDWQCPLAQGAVCASVVVADPAVPEAPTARDRRGAAHPPDTIGAEDRADGSTDGSAAAAPDCGSGCSPFGWLARLFAPADEDAAARPDVGPDDGHGAAPAAAPLPDEDSPSGEALRAPERIARVWIAPWVDADGVWREASWVRIVIAPARWRRP